MADQLREGEVAVRGVGEADSGVGGRREAVRDYVGEGDGAGVGGGEGVGERGEGLGGGEEGGEEG